MTELRSVYITDPITGDQAFVGQLVPGLLALNAPEYKVHLGDAYMANTYLVDVAVAGTLTMAFKTSLTNSVHMTVTFASEGKAHYHCIEGPTWDTNTGTATPVYNRNRFCTEITSILEDKTATPAFTATGNYLLNPTNIAGGTVIHKLYNLAEKQAASAADTLPIILNADTLYAFQVTNDDSGAKDMQLFLNWYEHPL
jgi:hypothetical protein